MVIEPCVQVNPIEQAAPAKAHRWHAKRVEQRDADTEIGGSLFLAEEPRLWERR